MILEPDEPNSVGIFCCYKTKVRTSVLLKAQQYTFSISGIEKYLILYSSHSMIQLFTLQYIPGSFSIVSGLISGYISGPPRPRWRRCACVDPFVDRRRGQSDESVTKCCSSVAHQFFYSPRCSRYARAALIHS